MTLLVVVNDDDVVVSMQAGVASEALRRSCSRRCSHARFVYSCCRPTHVTHTRSSAVAERPRDAFCR